MEIAASTNTDAINTPPTHLKQSFKYSKELKGTQPQILSANLEAERSHLTLN